MKKQTSFTTLPFLLFLFLPMLSIALMVQAQEDVTAEPFILTGNGTMYTQAIPVIDLRKWGQKGMPMPAGSFTSEDERAVATQQGGGSDPTNSYAVIRKSGSAYASPETAVRYEITLANYDSITHSY